jgi:nodulation protein E
MGSVSAVGIGAEALWQAARDGRSGVKEKLFERLGNKQRVKIAAAFDEFDAAAHLEPEVSHMCDRFARFALVAADEAMAQAQLPRDQPQGDRTAVIVGTGIGGAETIDIGNYQFFVTQDRGNPLNIPLLMPNAAASQISMRYGCRGPSFAIASACSSASQSIGIGLQMVRSGIVDRAVVGGSEACLTATGFKSWELLRVLTPTACRPFSKGRNGMVLGEGAGILVIETAEMAQKRGAAVIADLTGYGTSSDAVDLIRPDPNGEVRAMRLALDDAGLVPDDIHYVNAHGTGTFHNDSAETQALRMVFGDRLDGLPISSTKPIHGHTLGAAGALELIVTIKALLNDNAPPTINWQEADPKCDLDMVPNQGRDVPISAAMSNSFAFGGINATLIVQTSA